MRSALMASSRLVPSIMCGLLIAGRPADAAPAGAVTGQGGRGQWTVTADVRLGPDGTVSGRLQIVGLQGSTPLKSLGTAV